GWFASTGARGNGQAVERRDEEGRARPRPRCNSGKASVIRGRIEHVNEPLSARHVDSPPLFVDEYVVNVSTGVALSKHGARAHIARAKFWWISEDNQNALVLLVERHRKITAVPTSGPACDLSPSVAVNDED